MPSRTPSNLQVVDFTLYLSSMASYYLLLSIAPASIRNGVYHANAFWNARPLLIPSHILRRCRHPCRQGPAAVTFATSSGANRAQIASRRSSAGPSKRPTVCSNDTGADVLRPTTLSETHACPASLKPIWFEWFDVPRVSSHRTSRTSLSGQHQLCCEQCAVLILRHRCTFDDIGHELRPERQRNL